MLCLEVGFDGVETQLRVCPWSSNALASRFVVPYGTAECSCSCLQALYKPRRTTIALWLAAMRLVATGLHEPGSIDSKCFDSPSLQFVSLILRLSIEELRIRASVAAFSFQRCLRLESSLDRWDGRLRRSWNSRVIECRRRMARWRSAKYTDYAFL